MIPKTLCLLAMVLLTGCACFQSAPSVPETNLILKTTPCTNQGAPLCVVLKFTDFPHFLAEDYQSIASHGFMPSEEDPTLTSVTLIPGGTRTIKVKTPEGKSPAVFCLFTDCGESWKHLIDPQDNCKNIKIVLGEHEIDSVETW